MKKIFLSALFFVSCLARASQVALESELVYSTAFKKGRIAQIRSTIAEYVSIAPVSELIAQYALGTRLVLCNERSKKYSSLPDHEQKFVQDMFGTLDKDVACIQCFEERETSEGTKHPFYHYPVAMLLKNQVLPITKPNGQEQIYIIWDLSYIHGISWRKRSEEERQKDRARVLEFFDEQGREKQRNRDTTANTKENA